MTDIFQGNQMALIDREKFFTEFQLIILEGMIRSEISPFFKL